MFDFLRDLRLAVRMATKKPWTMLVAVLSLAIAIGPNSAVFTIIDSLMLKPSSVEGGQVFRFRITSHQTSQERMPSYPDLLDYKSGAGDVADVIACIKRGGILDSASGREMVVVHVVTENYFSALGAQPAAGRILAERDATFNAERPIVISHRLAIRRFGGDAAAVGKDLPINGGRFSVVGVMGRGFRGPTMEFFPPDVWIPFGALRPENRAELMQGKLPLEEAVVVVRKGVPLARVEAALSVLAQRLASEYPGTDRGTSVKLELPRTSAPAQMILCLVGLVLLIACANVAGILMAYGEERRRAFSVRMALGAPRGRLIRLLVMESLFLALTAAALGLLMAAGTLQAMRNYQPIAFIPFQLGLELDYRGVGYTVFLSVVAALAAGLTPALRFSRPDLIQDLRSGTSTTARRQGFRTTLVVLQVTVSQFLLVSAALLFGSYLDVQRVRPGFDVNRSVVAARLSGIGGQRVDYARIEDRLRAVPGVLRISSMSWLFLSGSGGDTADVFLPGMGASPMTVSAQRVGPKYFAIMGTRLPRGRDFETNDLGSVVVNEAMARQYWGSADEAMGKVLRVGKTESLVVGVAENGKYYNLQEDPQPLLFISVPLSPEKDGALLIETAPGCAAAVRRLVQNIIRDTQPGVAVIGVATLSDSMSLPLFPYRMAAALVTILAVLGVSLAGVGLYGLISCSVAQRTREIGLRVALGATPTNILPAVLLGTMWRAMVGSLIGVALALATLGVLGRQIHGLRATDPMGIATGVLAFLVVAALAAYAPARRAMRVDPMEALREE